MNFIKKIISLGRNRNLVPKPSQNHGIIVLYYDSTRLQQAQFSYQPIHK